MKTAKKTTKSTTKNGGLVAGNSLARVLLTIWGVLVTCAIVALACAFMGYAKMNKYHDQNMLRMMVRDASLNVLQQPLISVEQKKLVLPEVDLAFKLNTELGEVLYDYEYNRKAVGLTTKKAVSAASAASFRDSTMDGDSLSCSRVLYMELSDMVHPDMKHVASVPTSAGTWQVYSHVQDRTKCEHIVDGQTYNAFVEFAKSATHYDF